MKKLLMLLMSSPLAISPAVIASCGKGGDSGSEAGALSNTALGDGLEPPAEQEAYSTYVQSRVNSLFSDFYATRFDNLVQVKGSTSNPVPTDLKFFNYDNMANLVTTATANRIVLADPQAVISELENNALFSRGQLNDELIKLSGEAGFNRYLDKNADIFTGFELADSSGEATISSQVINDPVSATSTTLITFTIAIKPGYLFSGSPVDGPTVNFTFSFFENGNSTFSTFFQNWVSGSIGADMYASGVSQFDEDELNMGGDATHEATHEQNEVAAFDSLSTVNSYNDATKHKKFQEALLEYTTAVDTTTPDNNVNQAFLTQLDQEFTSVMQTASQPEIFKLENASVESSTNSFGLIGISDAQPLFTSDGDGTTGEDVANLFFRDTKSGTHASDSLPVDFINELDMNALSTNHGSSASDSFITSYNEKLSAVASMHANEAISYGAITINGIKLDLDLSGTTIEMPPLALSYDYTPTVMNTNQAEMGTMPSELAAKPRLAGYYYLLTKYFEKWRQATGIFASDSANGVIQFHPSALSGWANSWSDAQKGYFNNFLKPLYGVDQQQVADPETLGLAPGDISQSNATAIGYLAKNYFLKDSITVDQATSVSGGVHYSTAQENASNNYPSLLIKANTMVSGSGMYWDSFSAWKWYNNKSIGGNWVQLTADSSTASPFELRIETEYFFFKVAPSAAQLQSIYDGKLAYMAQVL